MANRQMHEKLKANEKVEEKFVKFTSFNIYIFGCVGDGAHAVARCVYDKIKVRPMLLGLMIFDMIRNRQRMLKNGKRTVVGIAFFTLLSMIAAASAAAAAAGGWIQSNNVIVSDVRAA